MPAVILIKSDFFFPEFMNDDERNLYEKLYEMFQEDASTVIDLPGNGYLTFVKKKTQIDLILELFLLDMNRIKQSICLHLLLSLFSFRKQSQQTHTAFL